MDFLLWEKCYALPGSDSADYKCCLLEVILGMVQELGSCWTVWGWYGLRGNITSPWAGLLCHPAIPAARPRARWQRKFPELSTCNVTLITQRDKQKGGYWSRLLPGWLSCHLWFPYFFIFIFCEPLKIQTSQQKTGGKGSVLSIPIAHKA